MFALDRDLLALEPTLFRDVGWAGQELLAGEGHLDAGDVVLTNGNTDFQGCGLSSGHVVVVDRMSLEVIEVTTATVAQVSRLRATRDGPAEWAVQTQDLPIVIRTFGPQIGVAHRQVLRMLGLDTGDADETAVVNPDSLVHLESLGALHLIFSAAAAFAPGGSPLAERAAMYRERFEDERGRVRAEIDLNGDGIADATRRPNVMLLGRG
ncbi:MAG: hypothetical protein AAF747_00675 [Planctomycetota bacterium]